MSSLTQAERDKLDAKWFAGPNRTYPIVDCEDVQDAWDLASQAANPDQVRAGIVRLAQMRSCPMPHMPYRTHGEYSSYSAPSPHGDAGAAGASRAEFAKPARAIATLTYLTDPAFFQDEPPEGYVRRTGKIFEVGSYPDQQFSLSEAEADTASANFAPKPADLEHKNTVLDGRLGVMRRIWREGKAVFGQADVPEWLHNILGPDESRISCAWDRVTKSLEGWGWVLEPAISDAALFSAHATFAAAQQALLASMPEVPAGAVNTAGGGTVPAQGNNNLTNKQRKARFNMTLAEMLARRIKQGSKPPEAQTAAFSAGTGVTLPTQMTTIDQLIPTMQALAANNPQVAQALQTLQGVVQGQAGFAQPLQPTQGATGATETAQDGRSGADQGTGEGGVAGGPQNGAQTVAQFAAPGYVGEPMDAGQAEFRANQIVTRAEEAVERLIADGKLHQFGKAAALACFTAAGHDNEAGGPSLVTFSRADGTVLNDRVSMLMEMFAAAPAHSLFSKSLPVQVMNGSPDPATQQSAAEMGAEQARKANEAMYAHLPAYSTGNQNQNGSTNGR